MTLTSPVHPFLEPYRFPCGISTKNRIALAPMTNGQSEEDGSLGEDEYRWLEMRAQGGFGILISCAAHVSPEAQGFAGELGLFDDTHNAGLARLARMIDGHGALAIAQLYHGGVRCPRALTGRQPVSASAFSIDVPGFEGPRALETSEIADVTDAFAAAARRACTQGFHGVEIHGANGYLVTQFLSTQTNFRTDAYGGALAHRARFLLEIIGKVRAAIGPKNVLGVRLSPENIGAQRGLDVDESLQVARWLCEAGVDYVHLSLSDAFKRADKYPDSDTRLVTLFRDAMPAAVPLMTSGNIWTADDAQRAMGLGAQLLSLGKAAIANPAWPREVARRDAFEPERLPMSREHLSARGVGNAFAGLLELMRLVRP